jgi:hypothetical protein
MKTRLYDREAFRAMFSYGGTIAGLSNKGVSKKLSSNYHQQSPLHPSEGITAFCRAQPRPEIPQRRCND